MKTNQVSYWYRVQKTYIDKLHFTSLILFDVTSCEWNYLHRDIIVLQGDKEND